MRAPVFAIISYLTCVLVQSSVAASEQKAADVLTYHYDNSRTGWNSNETTLTPANVKGGSFGILYNVADLDEQVDAQPLVLSNFLINGQPKNIIILATEYNTLYALDADTGKKIAIRSLGPPVPKGSFCGNGSDHLGVNSTPVINDARDTLYLIAAVWSGSTVDYVLHAVDLTTIGDPQHPFVDKVAPVRISASAKLTDGSVYNFQPEHARQRSAILLTHDRVYAGFATMCDWHPESSRGWLLGWDARSLAPVQPELTDLRPVSKVGSGRLGAIWMSGYGPAADADGNIFVVTGNSNLPLPNETLPPVPSGPDTYLSDSVVRLSPDLKIFDWFTPSDRANGQHIMDQKDRDLGSGGVMLFPDDNVTRALPLKAAVAAGKTGQMYLLDRPSLGKFDPSGVNHVLDVQNIGNCYCGPSYFEGADGAPRVVSSGNNGLAVWTVHASGHSLALVKDYDGPDPLGTTFFQGGFFTSVSSNNNMANSAIIWAVRRPQREDPVQSLTLYAYDAKDGTHLCAADAGPWPNDLRMGYAAAPNAVPVVANGKVIIASYKELRVFGIGGASACGVNIAQTAQHDLAEHLAPAMAPSNGQFVEMKGTIVDLGDTTLHLKSDEKTVEVDLTNVLKSGRHGNMDPGKPVTIRGIEATPGVLTAESIISGN